MVIPLPSLTYTAPGGLRKGPHRDAKSLTEAKLCGRGVREMRVLLSALEGARTSNRWWDWRCGCGNSGRRCGYARRRSVRSG